MGFRTGRLEQAEIDTNVENLLLLCPTMSEFISGVVTACRRRAERVRRLGESSGEDEVILTSLNWEAVAKEFEKLRDGLISDIEKRPRGEFCPSQLPIVAEALHISERGIRRAILTNARTVQELRMADRFAQGQLVAVAPE